MWGRSGGIAELRAKLDRPPKTPDNSSIPPSRGHKPATEFVKNRRKKKPHPGAHRPLHPNPTQRRDVLASVRALRGRRLAQPARALRGLRPDRDSPDRARDHAGEPAWRGLPVLRQALQGRSAGGARARLAVRPQPAGLRHLSALHPGRRLRAAVAPDERPVRPFDQRRRARQHSPGRAQALRRSQRRHPRPAVDGQGDLFRRNRLAGRQAKLVAVGFPPWRKCLFPHPSPTLQGGGRTVPRRRSSARLGLRSIRRPGRLGHETPAGLPCPSPARHPIRHRRGRRRLRPGAATLHRLCLRRSGAARQMERRHSQNRTETPRKPNSTGSSP